MPRRAITPKSQHATARASRYQLSARMASDPRTAKTVKSQTITASMMKPIACLKRSIHAPGFGSSFIHFGCAVSRKYGRLMPAAMVRKRRMTTGARWVTA